MARWVVTEQVEVLQEHFSEVIAKYIRFFVKNNISVTENSEDLVVQAYLLLCREKDKSLSARSLADIDIFKGKCLFGKELIDRVFVE